MSCRRFPCHPLVFRFGCLCVSLSLFSPSCCLIPQFSLLFVSYCPLFCFSTCVTVLSRRVATQRRVLWREQKLPFSPKHGAAPHCLFLFVFLCFCILSFFTFLIFLFLNLNITHADSASLDLSFSLAMSMSLSFRLAELLFHTATTKRPPHNIFFYSKFQGRFPCSCFLLRGLLTFNYAFRSAFTTGSACVPAEAQGLTQAGDAHSPPGPRQRRCGRFAINSLYLSSAHNFSLTNSRYVVHFCPTLCVCCTRRCAVRPAPERITV